MHELSIVFHIAKTVEEVAKENKVDHVRSVTVRIGEVSTIVNPYLEDCWNWNANRSEVLKGCKLKIETIKAVTYCEDCKNEYPTVENGKICPHCGSEHTYLLTGNEITIKEIEVVD